MDFRVLFFKPLVSEVEEIQEEYTAELLVFEQLLLHICSAFCYAFKNTHPHPYIFLSLTKLKSVEPHNRKNLASCMCLDRKKCIVNRSIKLCNHHLETSRMQMWKPPYLYGFRMEKKNALNNVVAYPRTVKIKRTAWDHSSSLLANNCIPQIFEVITTQPKDLVLQTLVSNKFITPSN